MMPSRSIGGFRGAIRDGLRGVFGAGLAASAAVRTPDAMSALDAEFWFAEDSVSRLHIAGVSIFAPPAPSLEEVRALLAAKVHLIPRYRQRVQTVPLNLGRPVWVDAADFDLCAHVRQAELDAPGGDAALCALTGRIMSQPLERTRPLWEAWLVDGLDDGRWALISKVHHCMVDGIAGVGLLNALLDLTPDAVLPDPPVWAPTPPPSAATMIAGAWWDAAGDVATRLGRGPAALRAPAATADRLASTLLGWGRFARRLGATGPAAIEGPVDSARVWAHAEADLADVGVIRQAFGGTVNDVVLAVLAGGYRALLVAHGDDPATTPLRTLVPVSVRPDGARDQTANRVSALLCDLPVHLGSPLERLRAVRRELTELKASHMAEAGTTMTRLGDLAPPFVLGPITHLISATLTRTGQQSINTVTTNVPGPQFPLWCLGREMEAYLPYVPIGAGIRCGTAILSYNGKLAFGVTGDPTHTSDVAIVARTAVADLAALRSAAHAVGAPPDGDGPDAAADSDAAGRRTSRPKTAR